MRQTLKDYGYTMNQVPLLCDNESAIKIAYNSCEHSWTKHIDIRHHFLRNYAIKGDIVISHVRTNEQLVDIFTKPLDEKRFWELRGELNIIDSQNVAWKVAHLKCLLSCKDLSLQFIENPFLNSYDDFIAYRFMLAFIMLISSKYALYANLFQNLVHMIFLC
jgi:hypothetical protein